jgi:signal transduction histidine kinase
VAVAAVVLVLLASLWSARQERAAALADFSHEQTLLARSIAVPFAERLGQRLALPTSEQPDETRLVDDVVIELLGGAPRLEEPGESMILVSRPNRPGFLTTDHRVIASSSLRAAIATGQANVEIPRDDATTFGLPRRLAVAGIARVPARTGEWGVVVLASARRLRVRQEHEEWRLALTVLVVSLVVAASARSVQRRQRRELELERRVAVADLLHEHDAALAKADKMATLAALSTGIAHELGTPLAVIVGRVDQVIGRLEARASPTDEKSLAALRIVLAQVERIERIVKGSLALARGERPTLEIAEAATCWRHAIELVRHRFEAARVRLEADLPSDLPPIACDARLFEQALVNLLLNACQATPEGGSVHASARPGVDGTAHVVFEVNDEGTGISDAAAQRATEPFFSTKREAGGSGLGLTIVREIVSHHGGTFTLGRRQGVATGTCATITLPAAR